MQLPQGPHTETVNLESKQMQF